MTDRVIVGSNSLIHHASVMLIDDDIKSVPGMLPTFYQIAPAHADRILFPTFAIARLIRVEKYTNVSVDDAFFGFQNDAPASTGLVNAPGNIVLFSSLFGSDPGAADFIVTLVSPVDTATANASGSAYLAGSSGVIGKALSLSIYNGDGALTGGDPANTLTVATEFRVFDMTTGRFLTVSQSGWHEDTRSFS